LGALRENVTRERSPMSTGLNPFFRGGCLRIEKVWVIPGQMNPEIELLHLSRMVSSRGGVNITTAPANTVDSCTEAFIAITQCTAASIA